jgi:glycosyltransferase involved in cell wall biosynthesis
MIVDEKKVFFLNDSKINNWLVDEFSQKKFSVIFMGIESATLMFQKSRLVRIYKLHSGYLRLAINCLKKSCKNDVIICFLDVQALYLFFLTRLLFEKREIIVLNIMLSDHKDIITNIKRYLFKLMLKNEHVYPTVTSYNLSSHYKKLLNLPKKEFYLLHDCYGGLGEYKRSYKNGEGYVFCGGINGRDWSGLLEIAKLLPNVKFVIVGPKKDTLGNHGLSNIDYYFDIPFQKFQELIEDCSVLALPLNTQYPAGLIVIFTAGLISKPVITTDNITLREYITNEENGILVKLGDYENFAKELNLLISNQQKQKIFGEKLYNKIEAMGSPKVFVDTIIKITSQIK